VARRLASMTQPIRPPPSSENVDRAECVGLRAWRVLRDVSATAPLDRPENAPECSENVERAASAPPGRSENVERAGLWAHLEPRDLPAMLPPECSENVERAGLRVGLWAFSSAMLPPECSENVERAGLR